MEITTPQDGTAEPLQVVEELIYMDRYVDDERMISARKDYYDNKTKLETLYARRDLSKKTHLDLSSNELLNTTSNYLERLAEADDHFSNSREETESAATLLRSIASDLEKELEAIEADIAIIEKIQQDMFSDLHEHPYRLHAVCLHHGQSNRSGHYSIYIHDKAQSVWFYYNDENVTRVTDTRTIFKPTLRTDARPALLVYIRAERHDELVKTVNRDPAPEPPRQEALPPYEGML